ncbi:MAG TPA: cupredoxin domain-containing protein [Thiobacillaceae bacterium]|nr:cupredoxin domain-containing protein [Thiobacillaceae bacterium]HNF88749.1 cupredoxin domain-containing protein [Thiobacillaceae bacterium]HNH89003.1 cupredoxin domain-containing protein [Thiobacillaceae bacterium]
MKRLALFPFFLPLAVSAADVEFSLAIKEHRFVPAEFSVPAGKKIKLLVSNQDSTPEEFESHALNREKVIAGKGQAVIYVGPLAPGRYPFFGEFNERTAQGVLVAE